MSQVIYIIIAIVLLIALAIYLIPASTNATREISFDASINEVWAVYTEPERQPDWRTDVGAVSVSEDGSSWTETLEQTGMTIHFKIVEKTPPHRLVLQTGSPGSFEGSYTAEFREEGGKTIGVFTEESTSLGVIPKVLRFLFVNQGAFIEKYAEEASQEIARRRDA